MVRALAALVDDPGFSPQHPHGSLPPSLTPVAGDLEPPSGLHWYCTHTKHIHAGTYALNRH